MMSATGSVTPRGNTPADLVL